MIRSTSWGKGQRRVVAVLFAAGLGAGGCESTHFGVGGGAASGLGGSGPGPAFDPGDAGFPGDATGLGAATSWTGYVENYHFVSGSDALKLSFAVGADGVVAGTLTLGAGSPPPPATDPNVGYLPGVQSTGFVVEGFPYTMAGGTLTGSRLRFAIWTPEVWTGWCALQTPLPSGGWCFLSGSYEENANGTSCAEIDPNGQRIPIDCIRLDLCTSGICTCDDARCVASFRSGKIDFDISLMAAVANGSAGISGNLNVRLTKDP